MNFKIENDSENEDNTELQNAEVGDPTFDESSFSEPHFLTQGESNSPINKLIS